MARLRKPGGGGGSSAGAAGGVLSGTFPDPGFAVDMATQAELNAAIAALTDDPAWNAIPALQNSWVASGSVVPRYCIDPFGYVQVEGEVQAGTVTVNTLVFTFPVGFRPTKRYTFLCAGASSAAIRGVAIGSNGQVTLNYAASATETLSLSMIRFPIF